jgi:hypothetical protein
MPIEIRQLVIRAIIEEDSGEASGSSEAAGGAGAPAPGAVASERARLIAECVDQVMETLREQRER